MADPITAVAIGGHVDIQFTAGLTVTLTIEQADAFWNQVAEAELVALEQRVRARRRVTEGARGGWVNAEARGKHAETVARALGEHAAAAYEAASAVAYQAPAPDVGMALAESAAAALDRLAPQPTAYVCPQCGPDANGAEVHAEMMHVYPPALSVAEARERIGRLTAARDLEAARDWVPRHAAPDYQHPEPGDNDEVTPW